MRVTDALNILGLNSTVTIKDIKTAYREACKRYHPDINPAGQEMMKAINDGYAALENYQSSESHIDNDEIDNDYGEHLNDALNAIINLNLNIEICGAWVWVSGNTYPVKDRVKDAGFKYASKKKMWYFRPEKYRSKNRKSWDIDKIRAKHGSKSVKEERAARALN